MSFEFKRDKSIQQQVRKLLAGDIDEASAMLRGRGARRMSRDKAVHEARKLFKRQRALVRLVRGAVGKREFRRANHAFRDAGRALAAKRDAKILLDAFDGLVEQFAGELKGRVFSAVRRKLIALRKQLTEAGGGLSVSELLKLLGEEKRRCRSLKLKHDHWKALAAGLERTYRDGRRAMGVVIKDCTFETLHEWRKRVKDLWHQVQLLEPCWPEELKRLGDDLHGLSDLLGDDHDLAVLRQTLAEDAGAFGSGEKVDTLVRLIDVRRGELEANAIALGERLYAEKPARFVERLGEYWQTWQDGDRVGGVH